MKKILFVCRDNQYRSVEAERMCREIAESRGLEIEVASAGVDVGANRVVTPKLVQEYDLIAVMLPYMKDEIERYKTGKPIRVLGIPNSIDPSELKKVLAGKIPELLKNLCS